MAPVAHQSMPLALLPVQGNKVAEFLQGYLTCNCDDIRSDELLPWALCNLKGRVVANGWAVELDEACIGLIMHSSLLEAVATMLTPYARFHRCTLDTDQSKPVYVQPSDSLERDPGESDTRGEWSTPFGKLGTQPIEVSGAHDADFARSLIKARLPIISSTVTERFLPQVLNLVEHGSVDFSKGCYLGQEIVARAQFRGAVKKTVQCFVWQDTAPEIGQPYTSDAGTFECVLSMQTDQNETNPTLSGIALGITRAEEPT